ncbi:hypothetical protein MBGDN05_00442 [Thermoplasmatales archaeon SCGC AB-539-N05]|nr:hypothetical protein MBGDN05_00442 [Thermoplasmatales archaeon SCGC AB-539-N05]
MENIRWASIIGAYGVNMYLMITTTNENIHLALRAWWSETKRPYLKKWMIRKLGPMNLRSL